MAVTPFSFRGAFPAFNNPTTYSDPVISFWIGLATKLTSATRWGDVLDYGIMLFVAHNLSLEFNSNAAAKKGQNPGFVTGPVTSASVDKVSYSRDPSAAMDPKAGHWNLTTYGLRYWRLIQMMGAGPVQIGAPSAAELNQYPGAWPGPYGGM